MLSVFRSEALFGHPIFVPQLGSNRSSYIIRISYLLTNRKFQNFLGNSRSFPQPYYKHSLRFQTPTNCQTTTTIIIYPYLNCIFYVFRITVVQRPIHEHTAGAHHCNFIECHMRDICQKKNIHTKTHEVLATVLTNTRVRKSILYLKLAHPLCLPL